MPFPTSCFIIGAQKAGTTTLASLLESQSALCVSSPKEPLFFSKHYEKGTQWYETCFYQPEKSVLIDASPDYSRAPTDLFPLEKSSEGAVYQDIPRRIYEYNPDAKFIYLLRNPITRTYSSYWHNIRANYEDGNFSDLIRSSDRYLVASDYSGQLANYLQHFKLEQFHFILFEQFVQQPQVELKRCCDFLGSEYQALANEAVVHKNASYQMNTLGKLSRKMFARQRHFKRFSRLLDTLLPAGAKRMVKQLTTTGIPVISPEDKAYLFKLFEPGNIELARVSGLDLSQWL